jgi:hypothetical protein
VHPATTLTQVALLTTAADTEGFDLGLIRFLVHQLSGKNPELFCNLPSCTNKSNCNFVTGPNYKNSYSPPSEGSGSTKYKKKLKK